MRRLLLALLLTLSCQDYLFDQVCPEAIRESSIVMPAATPTPADILFIVDNSGSMADEQENLATNFDRFINQIAGAGDYHIAVVTTDLISRNDMGTPIELEGQVDAVYTTQHPFTLDTIQTTGCAETNIAHGCFRGPDPATRILRSQTMDAGAQISVFAQNVRVGSCGSGDEQGLEAMITALGQRDACNDGFLRDSANLIIIIVSDEEDASRSPVAQYVEQLKAVKSAAQIRVAAIIGYADGRPSDCSIPSGSSCGGLCQNMPAAGSQQSCNNDSQCPGNEFCVPGENRCENYDLRWWDLGYCFWCSYYNTADCCSAVAGNRYADFALGMEREITQADSSITDTDCRGGEPGQRVACRIDTICQANFGDTLAAIARDLVITNTYNLNPPAAYPPGVNVIVKNGRFGAEGKKLVYDTDFTVSADGSVLTLVGENTPTEGEDIEIHFVVSSDNRVEQPRGACMVSGSP